MSADTSRAGAAHEASDPKAMDEPSVSAFWSANQPGFRFASEPVGTKPFFEEVERHRYALEPAILEKANFPAWAGHDVLEAGCGIGTDGINFARGGARYTGIDFSESAIRLAHRRFEMEGVPGRLVESSITCLPVADESQDLVYSNGVIHHVEDTRRAVDEMYRVLRPGGRALVMVYHRDSLNYRVSIMLIRRLLALLVLLPGAPQVIAWITGETPELVASHRGLFREFGLRYILDSELFLNNNTDGPGNPLSTVFSRRDACDLFRAFSQVKVETRSLNLRIYPGGPRLSRTGLARRLERKYGWALWVEATKLPTYGIRR